MLLQLVTTYSYFAIFALVGIESVGIPLPGETALVTASIYSGVTHKLSIFLIIFASTLGAILGDNLGYWIGKKKGFLLFRKYGKIFKINENKLKVGLFLFNKHGGQIVFYGRFFSLLRMWAAFLAGVSDMMWIRFLIFNALGGFAWSFIFGIGAYLLGNSFYKFNTYLKITTIGASLVILAGLFWYFYHNEKSLERLVEKEMPGSIENYK